MNDSRPSFSYVYAVPLSKQREFFFHSAEDLYNHVSRNNPAVFHRLPKLNDEDYDERMTGMAQSAYRIPEEKREK